MIWECEIRPAVAGRASARNLKFEKREGRKLYYAPNPLRGGASKGARGGRGEYGVETERRIDCWRLGIGRRIAHAPRG